MKEESSDQKSLWRLVVPLLLLFSHQLCPTLCYLKDCSMAGFPVLQYILEFAQTHVHWVDDAIQPSHPLSPPCLLPSIFPSIRVFSSESALCISATILPMTIQGWFPLILTSLISLQSKGLSRVFSNITVQKHQVLGAQLSLWSNSHIHMTTQKSIALLDGPLSAKWCLCFLICCLGFS